MLRFCRAGCCIFQPRTAAREEFSVYINEDRSIRAQKLDLAPQQKLLLIEYLLEEVSRKTANIFTTITKTTAQPGSVMPSTWRLVEFCRLNSSRFRRHRPGGTTHAG